jgi:hypothetical protein
MPKIQGNKIIWDSEDWLAGLHPQFGTNLTPIQKGGNYMANMRSFNPFRFYGYASPNYNNSAITNSATVLGACPRKGVNNAGYAYIIEQGAKLHRLNIITEELLNDSAGVGFPHTITHGAHTAIIGNDCVLYNHKVGGTSAMRYLYSFSDATDWDIGTCDMSVLTPAFDDDFMSTAPSTPLGASYITEGKGYPHPMEVGYDDILYIGDRNYLHAYDGQGADNDGAFSPAVLTLPNGWIITSMVKLAPRSMAIFAYYSASSSSDSFFTGDSKVFLWDYLSLDPYDIRSLNDNYVSESFSYKGTIGCFTQGRAADLSVGSKISRLQLYNGTEFEEVYSFTGKVPIRGGVDIQGDQIKWLSELSGADWTIYSYNDNFDGDKKLFKIGEVGGGANYLTGMLRTFSSTLTVGGSGTTAAGKLEKVSANYIGGGNSTFFTSLLEFPGRIRIKNVRIYFGKTSTGGRAITLQFYDRLSNVISLVSSLKVITQANQILTLSGLNTSGDKILPMDGIRLVGSWGDGDGATDAPIVSKVEAEYELIPFI